MATPTLVQQIQKYERAYMKGKVHDNMGIELRNELSEEDSYPFQIICNLMGHAWSEGVTHGINQQKAKENT